MTLAKNRGLILALGGAGVLLAATLLAYRPVAPRGIDAAPETFSAARALDVLRELVGNNDSHPIGSPANARVRDLIVKRLESLGYRTELQTGLICNDGGVCGVPTNIIATLGETFGNDALLLAAHYDSVAAGPGASDDGVGVAAVLEIARILQVRPKPAHAIVLLVTDGEEAGLLGAQLFVREHRLAKKISAAVNLDARGVSGSSLMFETGSANAWLMRLYAAGVNRPITNSLFYVVYKSLPNDTDFTVFKAASYQGFNLAFIGDVAHYHTPLDNWANASASSIQHQGENALNALLALEGSTDSHPPASESVFFDVFARAIVVMPAKIALPVALAAMALLLAEAALLLRGGLVSRHQAGWGVIAAPATLLFSTVFSMAMLALLRAFGALPPLNMDTWIAHPLPMNIASPAMVLWLTGAVGWWTARRAGFWGLWLGSASWIVLLSVAAAALQPSASYIVLLTALAAVLAALPCVPSWYRSRIPSRAVADFAVLVPWFVVLAVLLPVLLIIYPGLGALAWILSAMALALAASLLLPLLAGATLRARKFVIAAAAALTLGGMLITLALPVYSSRWPQRVNVEYWLDADADHAHWWVYAASSRLPATMAAVASFDSIPRARFRGSSSQGFFADAPQLKLAAPELEQTPAAAAAAPHVTHYELILKSARGAQQAFVVFPASADVQDVVVATPSGPLRAKLRKLPSGDTRLLVANLSADGVQFGIDAASQRFAVQVFDQSYGLPEELAQEKVLLRAMPRDATSSQDGDTTVVQRTVWLDPAAGR